MEKQIPIRESAPVAAGTASSGAVASGAVAPEALAPLFRVLGDPTRLRIVEALLERERTVSELVELLGVPQSRISNHLACLKWCRIAEGERRGRSVTYRIANVALREVLTSAKTLAAQHARYLASCTRIGPEWV